MPKTSVDISGSRIKERRKKWDLTQEYIAECCQTTRQHISQLEKQEFSRTNLEMLYSLSDVLRCTTDYLQGRVEQPDQILTAYIDLINDKKDGQNKPVRKERVLRKAFQSGDFRDSLIQKIYTFEPYKRLALLTVIKCLKNADEQQVNSFKALCKTFFSYTPKYEKKVLCSQDYIYCHIRDEILPNIEEDLYQFVFSDYALELEQCKMQNAEFNTNIKQNLGDFQKETKQRLHLAIKSAAIPHINNLFSIKNAIVSNEDNSSSTKNAVIPDKNNAPSIKNTALSDKTKLSFYKQYTMERTLETTAYILNCMLIAIKRQLKSKDLFQYFSHTKTLKERMELMRKLQKFLTLRQDTYVQTIVKDIFSFFNEEMK